MRRTIRIDRVAQDFGFALRLLHRSRGFSLAAVLTMAAGIGATTILFSVVDAVLLRSLQYPEASRLVQIWSSMPTRGIAKSTSSIPDYDVWQKQARTLESLGFYRNTGYNVSGVDTPANVRAAEISPSLLRVLNVRPRIGDWFPETASAWGEHRVVLLSDGFWRRSFGADAGVTGRTVMVEGESYRVAGVMPPSFEFPDSVTELWTPLSFSPNSPLGTRQNSFLALVGRLRPGVTPLQAQAELTSIIRDVNPQIEAAVFGLRESIVGDVKATLLLLLGAVMFVLLIACANVANLTLVRNASRRRELMVRSALGASRVQVFQQMLTESLVVAIGGGALGVVAAAAGLNALQAWTPVGVPRLSEVTVDVRMLAFALVVSTAAGLISGVLPAFTVSRIDVAAALKASARSVGGGRRDTWARAVMVAGEVGLAVMLLVGAGLMILTVARLQLADLGFRPQQLVTSQIELPESRYREPQRIAVFIDELVGRVQALPGVQTVGATSALPLLDTAALSVLFSTNGNVVRSVSEVPVVGYRQITQDYFRAMGATLARGRVFAAVDVANSPLVAIVNETLARRFWPRADAVGQTFHLGPPEALIGARPGTFPRVTIVGVINDIRHDGQDQAVKPELFVPYAQAGARTRRSIRLVARVSDAPLNHVAGLKSVVGQLDPNVAASDVRSMDDRVRVFFGRHRLTAWLLTLFGAMALLMAMIGIYGINAYVAGQRQSEMGVRLALGAQKNGLATLIVAQNFLPTLVGAVVGLLLASILSFVVRSQLFGVNPIDPAVYAGTLATMLVAALVASYLPVRRTLSMDPMRALRDAGDQ